VSPSELQLAELSDRYAGTTHRQLASGTVLVQVPNIALPAGWSKPKVDLQFLVPVGYPHSPPDCFWTDPDLRLANGALPQSARINPVPETGEPLLWFSWHLARPWNPNQDTLMTWIRVIETRLREAR